RLRAPLLVHAELPESIDVATEEVKEDDPRAYATYLASRPPTAEIDAVKAMIAMSHRFNVRVHIVHVAAAEAIRSDANCEGLWRALDEGVLDMVVSDHSPCPPELKRADSGDFFAAWGGIA